MLRETQASTLSLQAYVKAIEGSLRSKGKDHIEVSGTTDHCIMWTPHYHFAGPSLGCVAMGQGTSDPL